MSFQYERLLHRQLFIIVTDNYICLHFYSLHESCPMCRNRIITACVWPVLTKYFLENMQTVQITSDYTQSFLIQVYTDAHTQTDQHSSQYNPRKQTLKNPQVYIDTTYTRWWEAKELFYSLFIFFRLIVFLFPVCREAGNL